MLGATLLATSVAAWAEPELERIRAVAQSGDHAGALAQLDNRLTTYPDDRDARFLRAQVLAWSGDLAASRVAYDGLIAAAPDNVDYLFGRGQVWLWLGEPARALEDVRAARALAPDYAALAEFENRVLMALSPSQPPVAPAPGLLEVLAQSSWQNLDNGYDDWASGLVAGRARVATNTELRGSAGYQRRYGSDDVDASVGATWFGGGRFEFGADLGAAADADFLPEWSGQAHLLARVAPATSLLFAYRHAEYAATHSDTVSLSAEHYLDRFRLAYTLYRGDPADAPHAYSHVARVDYYYSEPNWVGLQYVIGEEAESDGAGGLLVSDVEGTAVLGRHALSSHWSLLWALTWHDQGDLYQRAGFDVGFARRF
jgi:YaiO family outer membrane protein